jgi:hypothetical protein
MKQDTSARFLRMSLDELCRAREHFAFSYQRVLDLGTDLGVFTPEELERVEAFTSRFARVVDLLTNKVLRALFRYELEPVETVLDRLHLAEKRGFVARAEDLRVLKEQRNVIAHDYAGAETAGVFAFCREHWARLDAICDRVVIYAERVLGGRPH